MSLDCTVFRNVAWLEEKYGPNLFDVDEDGQALPIAEPVFPLGWDRDDEIALSIRIGNISTLSYYREHLPNSLQAGLIYEMLWRERYKIEVRELDRLQEEISLLENCKELAELRSELQLLVAASREQNNPIVGI